MRDHTLPRFLSQPRLHTVRNEEMVTHCHGHHTHTYTHPSAAAARFWMLRAAAARTARERERETNEFSRSGAKRRGSGGGAARRGRSPPLWASRRASSLGDDTGESSSRRTGKGPRRIAPMERSPILPGRCRPANRVGGGGSSDIRISHPEGVPSIRGSVPIEERGAAGVGVLHELASGAAGGAQRGEATIIGFEAAGVRKAAIEEPGNGPGGSDDGGTARRRCFC